MFINKVRIEISPTDTEASQGIASKTIELDGSNWTVPPALYPRELRFIGNLEELVTQFNTRWTPPKGKNAKSD